MAKGDKEVQTLSGHTITSKKGKPDKEGEQETRETSAPTSNFWSVKSLFWALLLMAEAVSWDKDGEQKTRRLRAHF